MIEGLLIDVRADELTQRLDQRIAHHRAKASACEAQLAKFDLAPDADDEDEDGAMDAFCGPERSHTRLARKRAEHTTRAEMLTFIRDHLVPGEVYRLDEGDLRTAEILPRRGPW